MIPIAICAFPSREGRKAHPDEKGTEREDLPPDIEKDVWVVAKHIPMRRELKVDDLSCSAILQDRVAKHIPMRRELKEALCMALEEREDLSQSTSR